MADTEGRPNLHAVSNFHTLADTYAVADTHAYPSTDLYSLSDLHSLADSPFRVNVHAIPYVYPMADFDTDTSADCYRCTYAFANPIGRANVYPLANVDTDTSAYRYRCTYSYAYAVANPIGRPYLHAVSDVYTYSCAYRYSSSDTNADFWNLDGCAPDHERGTSLRLVWRSGVPT